MTMNRSEYLLTCLSEECAEVAQRVAKAQRFGLSEVQKGHDVNNAYRILDEYSDLVSVMAILIEDGILPEVVVTQFTIDAKRKKIEKYLEISRQQGTYTD